MKNVEYNRIEGAIVNGESRESILDRLINMDLDRSDLVELHNLAKKNGRRDLQIIIAEHLYNKMPEDIGIAHLYTLCLIEINFLEEAKNIATKTIDLFGDNLRSLLNIHEIHIRLGEYNSALDYAKKIKKIAPNDYRAYFAEFRCFEALHDIKKASECLHICSSMCETTPKWISEKIDKYSFINNIISNSDTNKSNLRVNAFLASGGMTHMLSCLGAALIYSHLTKSKCLPITEVDQHLQLKFYQIFDSASDLLIDKYSYERHLQKLKSSLSLPSVLPFTKPTRHSDGNVYYNLNDNADHAELLFKPSSAQGYSMISGFDHRFRYSVTEKLEMTLKCLTLKKFIKRSISKVLNNMPKRYVAVHFRNTDYESSIDAILCEVDRYVNDGVDQIYWATDDYSSLDVVRDRYPKINILNYSRLIPSKELGYPNFHCLTDNQLRDYGLTKCETIIDFFCDLAILSKACHYIPSPMSSIRHFVTLLRTRKDLYVNLFGKN
ncbi:MAG: hypothetical protein PHQ58_21470 [Rhodoferax sp.]|uniref:hypothetical protein n=1 Tax=Rhodoferax sp. TaxID=50421 RepID=UPI002633A25F|nr:hypothetical protein [Rhodoferax sp.]MDD2882990.1 hypothetical protein [Rhodoferax sp.]